MSISLNKQQLIEALNKQMRMLTANSVLFSDTIAQKAHIYSTDNECLDFLMINGPATAGKLAELTGLTTGAITAMIDRLENAGFVKRELDKNDRRKVIIVPNTKKITVDIGRYTISMGIAFEALTKEFSSDELTIVLKFLEKANDVGVKEISKLKINNP